MIRLVNNATSPIRTAFEKVRSNATARQFTGVGADEFLRSLRGWARPPGVGEFYVEAHALVHGQRLVTRDPERNLTKPDLVFAALIGRSMQTLAFV